jgi:hypothetical protein
MKLELLGLIEFATFREESNLKRAQFEDQLKVSHYWIGLAKTH